LISFELQTLKIGVSNSLKNSNLLKLSDQYLLELEISLRNDPYDREELVNKFSERLGTFQSLQNFE